MAFHEFIVSVSGGRKFLVVVGALALCGCTVLGPRSISGGRGVYAEVINRTGGEQILNVIVRLRYDESFAMISVASITSNLRFSAEAGANLGRGDDDDYAGNLIPFSAGVAYEENPTISYVPMSSKDFVRRMLSPISVDEWILLSNASRSPGRVVALAARRINGLRNSDLGEEPRSPKFTRFVEIYGRLRVAGVLDSVQGPEAGPGREEAWYIHDYQDSHGDDVHEFLDLLGIERKSDGSAIFLPVRMAVGSSGSAVHLTPRSAWEVLEEFGAGIEIPPLHLDSGIVEPLPREVPEDREFITVRSSEKRPDDAVVKIYFRDRWFYIDSSDTKSKRAFLFLRTFIGMRLADQEPASAPILTVPVN